MAVDAYPIDIDKLITGCQLLYSGLVVGQRIIPQVSVPIIVIPFRTAGVSTTLTDRYDDKASLGQTVGTHAHPCERIVHSLNLRSGIYIIDDRIYLRRIEVKRLVHYPIQVRYSVGSLHLEEFRELISCSHQLREVALLNGHDLAAVAVNQVGTRYRVDSGEIIHHKAGLIVHCYLMEEVSLCQQLQSAAIGIYPIQMFVIRILTLFTAVGKEINGTGSLVYLQDFFHMPGAFGNPVLQISFFIIQVQMCPAVALAPLDELLSTVEHVNRTGFLIRIHPLFYHRYD